MECFLEGYGNDGGCAEGIGYWMYGYGYYVYFADMLYQYTSENLDLLSGEKLKKIAEFPTGISLSKNVYVNYLDAINRNELHSGLMSKLASHFAIKTPEMLSVPSFLSFG